MKKVVLQILLLFLLEPVFAQEPAVRFLHGKLGNGLTYYIRHTAMEPGYADFYLVQNVGALMEEDNQNGLAHFLEHMAFNGSESFREGIPRFLERRGIKKFNAHTGQDETVYYMNRVPTRDQGLVDSCILVMRDWSGFLLLKPEEIDKERGVILEERRTRRNLSMRMAEQTNPYLYNHSKYATHDVIGSPEVINTFTPDELRAYYQDFYRPDLQAVIIVGDIDVEAVKARVEHWFGPIPARVHPKPRLVYEIPDNTEPLYVKAIEKEVPAPSITLMKRVRQQPFASAREMMKSNLLNRFYNSIMVKHLQAYMDKRDPVFLTTMVSYDPLVRNYNVWNILLQPYPHKDREALKQLMEEIERVHRFALNDQELKEQVDTYRQGLADTEKHKDQLSNKVYVQIYQNNFLEGKPITTVEEDLAVSKEILSGLTAADMKEWLASWNQDDKNWVFIMQGNDPAYDFPDSGEVQQIMKEAREAELSPDDYTVKAAPLMDFEVKGGEIVHEKKIGMLGGEEWTLGNGCKVYYKFSDQDGVKVSLLGERAGGKSLLDAGDLPSAQALSDLIMVSGVYKHDARTLQEILKGHQVNVSISLGNDFEGMSGVCDRVDAEMMFRLLYLFIEKPRFNRDDFDKYVYLSQMEVQNTPPTVNDTIQEQLRRLKMEDSPRLWKEDSRFYEAMSFDTMVRIYKDRFQNVSDFRFYLVGNIGREEARELVTRYLGALPGVHRKEKVVKYDLRKKGSFTETIEANIPDEKYMVNIEYRNTLKLKPEENLCLDILRMVLSNRYRDIIREEEGGSYGVQVGVSYGMEPERRQFLGISFESSVEKGDRMRSIVHEQIRKLITDGVDETEVEDGVLMMKKGRAGMLKNRGNAHWMEALRYYADTGKNLDDPALFEKVIDRINARKVQEVARKFFDTAECQDVVIRSRKE